MERILVVFKLIFLLEPSFLILVATVDTVPPRTGFNTHTVLNRRELAPGNDELLPAYSSEQSVRTLVLSRHEHLARAHEFQRVPKPVLFL